MDSQFWNSVVCDGIEHVEGHALRSKVSHPLEAEKHREREARLAAQNSLPGRVLNDRTAF